MSEYIKREAVIDEIESITWYHINCQKNLVEGAACEADALYKATDIYDVIKLTPTADVAEVRHGEWVEDQPTADVVEVVRCKDCAIPHNRFTGCPNLNGLIPPENHFCSFGERKEGDTE